MCRSHWRKKLGVLAAAAVITSLTLSGCGSGSGGGNETEKYRVDYCGQENAYANAEEYYEPGTEVELYYEMIATDTDYSFYLDDEPYNAGYDESKGYIIKFTMPKRDVKIEVKSENSMMYKPVIKTKIDDIDDDESWFVPLGIDEILLYEDGDLTMELDDALEDALGEYVFVAEDVREVYLLPFGNGGYRTIVFIKEDGTVSAVNMTKLLTGQELEVMDRLGGYQDVVSIEGRQDPDAMLVEAVMENGDRYLLDPYLK